MFLWDLIAFSEVERHKLIEVAFLTPATYYMLLLGPGCTEYCPTPGHISAQVPKPILMYHQYTVAQ